MRKVFMQRLLELAERDPNVYLIAGDVGFSVIEEFRERFGQRFINAGIAEQNMIGVAAGLAMAGKNVFVYSIIPFLTMRCFEQIRVDLCYQNLPVKLIGVGGGFSYGQMGLTHHALEDIAIMRALAGMTVLAPANVDEVSALVPQLATLSGPVYVRLSNYDEIPVRVREDEFAIGKAIEYLHSDECMVVTTGNALDIGYGVCCALRENGIPCGLVSMPTVKPLDAEFLSTRKHLKAVFTIEEHSVIGGLGETVARNILESFSDKIIFKAFGVHDGYVHCIGSRQYLRDLVGLNSAAIAQEIVHQLESSHKILTMSEIKNSFLNR